MSVASTATWQRIYHTTLFRFTREGREQILHNFRQSPDAKSATCIYDAEQHHFEISCLTADSEDAEKALVQVIAAFLQEEENKVNEFADYQRKAIKFSHALLDEGHDIDDDASEPDADFEGDDLIDLSAEPEKTSWVPSTPSIQLERCFSQGHLDGIGHATDCLLSLDLANRRIQIRPIHARANVTAAKRKLSVIEGLNATEIPAIHSLHGRKPQDLSMQLLKLHEKAEKDSAFNEDGTLSRLLFPEDSSVFDVRKVESHGKLLEKLMVLRAYMQEPLGELKPIKSQSRPYKQPTVTPATSAFSRIKFRKLGAEFPTFVEKKPTVDAEKPREQAIVEHWVEDVVKAQPKQPVQPAQLQAVNDIEREQQVKGRNFKAQLTASHATQSMRNNPQTSSNVTKNPTAAKPSSVKSATTKPATAWQTQKHANQNVFSTSTYASPSTSNTNPWNKQPGPSGVAWGSVGRPENLRPAPASAKTFSAPRGRGKPAAQRQQTSRGGMSSSMQPPGSSKSSAKPPPPPSKKSLASSNPFAQLGGQGQDEEDDDSSDHAGEEIPEQLAAEDAQPARLRVNRQKAPAPAPAPYFGPRKRPGDVDDSNVCSDFLETGKCLTISCDKKHDENLRNSEATSSQSRTTPENSEPGMGTTDDTSLDSFEGALPVTLILKGMNANEKQLRLASGYFQNALFKMRSSLERARAQHGSLNIKVQFGKVVIKQASGDVRRDITPNNFESKIKQIPRMNTLDQTFTNAATTSSSDIDNLLETLGIEDSSRPLHEGAFFEISCIRPDKTSCQVVVDARESDDEPAEGFARFAEDMLGVWYSHHPQHTWDSRLVITKHINVPLENINGANAFVNDLSIRHDPSLIAPNLAGKSNEGLVVQKVRFYSVVRWLLVHGFSPKDDIYIEVKRVLDYPLRLFQPDDPNSAHDLFSASCLPERTMIEQQRLRFELTLGLVNTSTKLIQNEPHPYIVDPACPALDRAEVEELEEKLGGLEPFEKANWKPEDVLSPEQLLALHEVGAKVVEKMDSVGARNRGFGAAREAELRKQKQKMAETPDQFW